MTLLVAAACELNRDENGCLAARIRPPSRVDRGHLPRRDERAQTPDQQCHAGPCLDLLVGRQTLSGVLAIARVGARRSWMESRACGRDPSRLIFLSARVVPGQVQKGSQVNIEDDFSRRP